MVELAAVLTALADDFKPHGRSDAAEPAHMKAAYHWSAEFNPFGIIDGRYAAPHNSRASFCRPMRNAIPQALGDEQQTGSVLEQELDPIRALGPEYIEHATGEDMPVR